MTWAQRAGSLLENDHVLMRPITPADRASLHAIAMSPEIWRYFVTLIETDADFDAFFDAALADQAAGRRAVFHITDKRTGRTAGSMSFGNMAEADGRLEIGWSWLGVEFQGCGVNRWAKYLMLEHAFEHLQAERVEFKTDALNIQARRGLTNIGATEEGTLRSFNPMPGGLAPMIVEYETAISASTPELADEGAGISEEHAWLLQLRREIMGYLKVPTMGDCTTYARCAAATGGHAVLAQTIDLNGDLDDQIGVLEVARRGSSRRALVLSFGGLPGYLGVNSDGLAIGLNLVLGGDWGCGLPPYLAIRHLLDNAATVDQAVTILRGLRLASSRSLTLCDATKTVNVEILDNELRLEQAPESVHTNHFLHPDFAARDELNIFARNSSVLRLEACRAALATLPGDASVQEHFALLSVKPMCVADTGDIRRDRTVATVVMLPERGVLHVTAGAGSNEVSHVFELNQGGE